MNWIGLLSLLLSIAISISTICLAPAISFYLTTTGFDTMNTKFQIFNYFAIFISCASIYCSIKIVGKWTKVVSYLFVFCLYITAVSELYFGYFMWIDSKGFISTIFGKWADSYESLEVTKIERNFNCCGFHYLKQFPGHCGNSNYTESCLSVMSVILQEPTEAIGVTFIFHAFIHGLIGFLLEITIDGKKKRIDYDAGEWVNDIQDQQAAPFK